MCCPSAASVNSLFKFLPESCFCLYMFNYSLYKGIVIELTAYLLKIHCLFTLRTIRAEAGLNCKGKFFFGIFIDHFIEQYNNFLPLVYYLNYLIICNFREFNPKIFLNFGGSPAPFVFIIFSMHLCENFIYLSQFLYGTILYIA